MNEDTNTDFIAPPEAPEDIIPRAEAELARELAAHEGEAKPEEVIPATEPARELKAHAPAFYAIMNGEVVHDPPRDGGALRELSPQEKMQLQTDALAFPNAARRREQEARIPQRDANVPTSIRMSFAGGIDKLFHPRSR